MRVKIPARKTKFKPGTVHRLELNRIRVLPGDLTGEISPEEISEICQRFERKNPSRRFWNNYIPPIKVVVSPMYKNQNLILVEGGEHYQTAKALGLEMVRCKFVSEAKLFAAV